MNDILIPDNYLELIDEINLWYESDEYSDLLNRWNVKYPDANEKIELPVE